MLRASLLVFAATTVLVLSFWQAPDAQHTQTSSGGRVVVCMIQLEHADAEHLASALKPFLSPQGSIVAHTPTNTLIIRDRASIVDMLAEIIKGQACTPVGPPPESDGKSRLDN